MVRIELYGGVISFGKEAYDFRNKNVISQLSKVISGHNVRLAIIDKRPQPPEALEAVKIACKRTGSKLYLSTASGDIEGGVFQEIILE